TCFQFQIDRKTVMSYLRRTIIPKRCKVKVNFGFKGDECILKHIGNHSHKAYFPRHLIVKEKVKLSKFVKKEPSITPKTVVVSVSAKTGEAVDSIKEILSNKDRVKFEINPPKRSQGMAKRSKRLEFDGFIQSAEVIPSKLRIILSAPKMKKHGLSFDAYSIVTDVTYKADEDGYYLCSSVLIENKQYNWIKHRLESHLTENNINILDLAQDYSIVCTKTCFIDKLIPFA
ncbi:hypothetical protein CU098_011343, partial [Rhizopus stolonifer]